MTASCICGHLHPAVLLDAPMRVGVAADCRAEIPVEAGPPLICACRSYWPVLPSPGRPA